MLGVILQKVRNWFGNYNFVVDHNTYNRKLDIFSSKLK